MFHCRRWPAAARSQPPHAGAVTRVALVHCNICVAGQPGTIGRDVIVVEATNPQNEAIGDSCGYRRRSW